MTNKLLNDLQQMCQHLKYGNVKKLPELPTTHPFQHIILSISKISHFQGKQFKKD